jgi:hypothetical protein
MASAETPPIYDDLMRFKPHQMTPNAWAMKAGVSRTVWADMRRHGNPSRRTLEKLLTAAGSSLAEFEALRIGGAASQAGTALAGVADRGSRPWGMPHLPALPVVRTAMGGNWRTPGSRIEIIDLSATEIIDQLPRPVSLAKDRTAYAITILGDSMWPRFRPGRHIAVSAQAPVAIGDDVLVRLRPGSAEARNVPALVKELVRKTAAGVELRQFNPDLTFEVGTDEIESIEKVIGELI